MVGKTLVTMELRSQIDLLRANGAGSCGTERLNRLVLVHMNERTSRQADGVQGLSGLVIIEKDP